MRNSRRMDAEYSVEEKAYLVSWAVAYNNCQESARLFREKYEKEPPPVRTLRYWRSKFIETGTIVKDRPRSGRPITSTTDEMKENVLVSVHEDPTTSTRKIGEEFGISNCSVSKILASADYHPYKPTCGQLLHDEDPDRRLEFAEKIDTKLTDDPSFIRKLKFSDECVFALYNRPNQHNIHYWDSQNPNVRIGNPGKTPTLTVWA